jgi:hypothetical protein
LYTDYNNSNINNLNNIGQFRSDHTPGEYMKDNILAISSILALIISATTAITNISIRGEDNFTKTLDLLNAHAEYRDDDRAISRFANDIVLRKIIRRQVARAYKPFSILTFIWFMIKFILLYSLSIILTLLAISPPGITDLEIHPWARAIIGTLSLATMIWLAHVIMHASSSESVIIGDNLEHMIYVHYLTELGFKQNPPSHKFKGTKSKFSWIKVPIHWVKIKSQFFSIHEVSRHYTQYIKTETQLKTLRNLNPYPAGSPRHRSWLKEHSWMKDRIAQTEEELRELRQILTKKWPNEFDALKDWTKYTRSLEQESIDAISRSSQRRV